MGKSSARRFLTCYPERRLSDQKEKVVGIAQYIDHTLLKPDAKETQIRRLCLEAEKYQFISICVNPCWVAKCAWFFLSPDSSVKICTVVGFPLGANEDATKREETRCALQYGALEVDMVMNIGELKSGYYDNVCNDIVGVKRIVDSHRNALGKRILLKVIIETCLLTDEEKRTACMLAQEAGADFVKTSTGFSSGGAIVEDVRLMREVVGPNMGVKASGSIRTYDDAMKMLDAGATRIGTSSGVTIVEEERVRNGK